MAGYGPGPMPAGAGNLIVAMVHHPQGQPWPRRIIPTQVDRLKAGVGPRPRQRPATARAGVRVVGLIGIRLEHLYMADPQRSRLFTRFTGRFCLGRFCLGRFYLGRFRLGRLRFRRLPITVGGLGSLLRFQQAARALPRRPTAWRSRTMVRSLVQPVPGFLEICQQPHRQPAQRLHFQGLKVVVDLAETLGAQVHGGRLQGSTIVFHTRSFRGSQPLRGGE